MAFPAELATESLEDIADLPGLHTIANPAIYNWAKQPPFHGDTTGKISVKAINRVFCPSRFLFPFSPSLSLPTNSGELNARDS